jgi:hypothetical protein
MRKFIYYTKKGDPSIMEVEIEKLTRVEDLSIMFLHPGEYKARILLPQSFHQKVDKKQADGTIKSTLVPDVFYSHAFFDTVELAQEYAERIIRSSFETHKFKHDIDYTEEEVLATIANVKVVML